METALDKVISKQAAFGLYRQEENPILYHYCDLDAFLTIIQTSTIRFSDINSMNDYGEIHWAYGRFIEAINIEYSKYEKQFFDDLDEIIHKTQLMMHPTIACFSLDGDVLSQWRAYADDGKGVSIGFDGNKLQNLAVKIGKVTYDHAEQVEFFKRLLQILFPGWKSSRKNPVLRQKFDEHVLYQSADMCLIKNPAFAEEKEVRLTRMLNPKFDGKNWSLTDGGGTSKDRVSKKRQNVKFRSRDGGLIAHVDIPFSGLGKDIIKEIFLGPKTNNNGIEVSMALSANGFKDVEIKPSRATYR